MSAKNYRSVLNALRKRGAFSVLLLAGLLPGAVALAQAPSSTASIPDNTQVYDPASDDTVTVTGTVTVTASTAPVNDGIQVQLGSDATGSGTGSNGSYQLSGSDTLTITVPSLPATVSFLAKAQLTGPAANQVQNVLVVTSVSLDASGSPTAAVQTVQTSSN